MTSPVEALPTIPGFIAYFHLRRTVQRWRDERDGPGTTPLDVASGATIQNEVLASGDVPATTDGQTL